jgi:hypothetical protein
MEAALVLVSLLGAIAGGVGCATTQSQEIAAPVVTAAPDEFVLRNIRTEAAPHLRCQAPLIDVHISSWSGSEGNVVAAGCGYRITYYLRCLTNHQCSSSRIE